MNIADYPAITSYSDLFFGLSGEDLPSFKRLTELAISEEEGGEDLPHETIAIIEKEMGAIHAVCKHFKYAPLIIEFSLISDSRLFKKEGAHFTSFMAFFVTPGPETANAYLAALKHMGDKSSGGVQIVPHPQMFAPGTGFVACDLGSARDRTQSRGPVGKRPFVKATRQPFEVLESSEEVLEQRVGTFLRVLRERMAANRSLAEVSTALAQSVFLLLPFVRPHFLSSAMTAFGEAERQRRGYPGGALFLFLEPLQGAGEVKSVAQALSWVLAEASLRESYATYAVEQSWKQAFATYSLAHPLKHRLGALAADTKWLLDSHTHAPAEFGERLKRHARVVEGVHGFASLCHVLYYAVAKGPEATIAARDPGEGFKFSTAGTLDVKQVIFEAAATSTLTVNRKMVVRCAPDFTPQIHGFAEIDGVRVRLNDELYREILFEVLANAYRHGLVHDDTVEVDAMLEPVNGEPAIVITNLVSERMALRLGTPNETWVSWSSESPTGLTFASHALQVTDAGRLYFRNPLVLGKWNFSVALVLRGLSNNPPDLKGAGNPICRTDSECC